MSPAGSPSAAPTRLVLVTCDEHPQLPADDRLLLAPLRAEGFQVDLARWDDPSVRWTDWPLVVLRAPWGYYLKPKAFFEWLADREREGARLFNPAPVVRWNADKRYLRDLERRGVAIVETAFIEPGEDVSLAQLVASHGWEEAVLKPAWSAGAHQTVRFPRAEAPLHQGLLQDILARGSAALVQPFLRQILDEGEWSFLFFNRQLSHAVLKRPAAGDFRVQEEFGGVARVPAVPPELARAAERVLAAVEGPLLYARVDGVSVHGRFLLGELEVIEPSLFLAQAPGAPERYARALRAMVG